MSVKTGGRNSTSQDCLRLGQDENRLLGTEGGILQATAFFLFFFFAVNLVSLDDSFWLQVPSTQQP